jgi:hypothetical protein
VDRRESLSREYDFPGVKRRVDTHPFISSMQVIAAVVCSLIVAGFLKGISWVGMPVVRRDEQAAGHD